MGALMPVRRYERVSTDNPILADIQERVEDALLPISDSSIVDGKLLTGHVLASGTTSVIAHGLGRKLKGWIVVSKNAAQHVYDSQASNETPDLFLHLTASGAVTVDLWVF